MANAAATQSMTDEIPVVENRRHWSFAQRHGLLLVCVAQIVANLIGSAFNIFYNSKQIEPYLSSAQQLRFEACWQVFNLIVYPVAIFCFVLPLLWLRPIHRSLLRGEPVAPERLQKAQRLVINLPWWFLAVTAVGWLSCIPVFPLVLAALPETLEQEVIWHLVTSFAIASSIAIPQSFFAVEMTSQKTLFPIFFRNENPAFIPGALPLKLTTRGFIWVASTVVSPVISLVLLLLVPDAKNASPMFGVIVGGAVIAFALISGWMVLRLVITPIHLLEHTAMRVANGDLNSRVHLLRADEFGPLAEKFNMMVEGLQERERIQETFGRHVGREAARQILQQDSALIGSEQVISVMFVDVRNFTAHSSDHSPEQVVTVLNIFFREAVDKIEAHGGMVNKFLGDGLMALFGIGMTEGNHAQCAIDAGQALLSSLEGMAEELEQAGWPGLKIGIGINTGPAIVGSIGSPKRQEYTAIGDTVNVASRVESLTKKLDCPLLITAATRQHLDEPIALKALPPQAVKGKGEKLSIFAVE